MKKTILVLVLLVVFLSSFALEKSYADVEIEEGNLIEYNKKILSGGVPDGIPAEEARKLFTGENAEYTIEGKKSYTSWNFGFPIDTRYTRTDRIISYSKKGVWLEKGVELDIEKRDMRGFILLSLSSFIGLLIISDNGQAKDKKDALFLCYASIFASVILTITVGLTVGKYSATAGYFISLFAIGLAGATLGKKLHWRYGFWGPAIFAWGNAKIGAYAHLSTDEALLAYVFFIISIGAISYLTASIVNHVFFRRETAEK